MELNWDKNQTEIKIQTAANVGSDTIQRSPCRETCKLILYDPKVIFPNIFKYNQIWYDFRLILYDLSWCRKINGHNFMNSEKMGHKTSFFYLIWKIDAHLWKYFLIFHHTCSYFIIYDPRNEFKVIFGHSFCECRFACYQESQARYGLLMPCGGRTTRPIPSADRL